MKNSVDDMQCCETCNHCVHKHLEKDGEYCRGMLHFCELRKRVVDKDDKCRTWQKSELLIKFEQEDIDAAWAQFKESLIINS